MKRKPAITIRMGAAHWDVSVHSDPPFHFNLRGLGKEEQRVVIFNIVRACREAGLVVT